MSKEPKRNVYVGHRYVPKIMEEWDKTISYEGLSIVTYQGASYTSKKRVPVGVDILNEEYWVVTGNYNAQVDQYRQEVRQVEKRVTEEMEKTVGLVNEELLKTETDLIQRGINVKTLGVKGDGSDETELIKNIVSSGGVFIFPSGVYDTSSFIGVPSDTILIGIEAKIKGFGFQVIDNENVSISGFTFETDRVVGDAPLAGVWVERSSDVNVFNNKFKNTRFYARTNDERTIYKRLRIFNNTFLGNFEGIEVANIINVAGYNQVLITGNMFECYNVYRFMKFTTGGTGESGSVSENYTKNLILSNNIITGSRKDVSAQVIDLYAGVGESLVTNNSIVVDEGIEKGASIIEAKTSGSEPSHTTTTKQKNLIISNNVIKAPSSVHSIMVYGGYGQEWEDDYQIVTITNNTIHNTVPTGTIEGIRVRGIHQIIVSLNNIEINSYSNIIRAVRLASCEQISVIGNVISRGNISVSDNQATTTGENYSKTSERIMITNNILKDWHSDSGIGINLNDGVNSLVIIDGNILRALTTNNPNSWAVSLNNTDFGQVIVTNNISQAMDNVSRNSVSKSSSTFNKLVDSNNSWNRVIAEGSGIPTSGYWHRGDRIENISPAIGGVIGWVCVTSGEPGTWRSYGTIE